MVKTGMYIVDLSNLDLPGKTFSIAMWQWFLHNSPEYKPYETLEIVNAAAFATEAGFEEVGVTQSGRKQSSAPQSTSSGTLAPTGLTGNN